jgi:general secretion pathway protein E
MQGFLRGNEREGFMNRPNSDGTLGLENLCTILLERGLINEAQRKEIVRRSGDLSRGRQRAFARRGGFRDQGPDNAGTFDVIAMISALKFERADDSQKALDEEAIYYALSREWGLPYKKIDPLKLDLNLVTGVIPHTFAKRHLVLPLAVEDGWLTVATPNPFNAEVLEDIARVSHLKVKPVVSSRSDIIKLINEFFGFKRSIAAAETQFSAPTVDLGNLEQYVRLKAVEELPSNDQHIVNAVNHLLSYAFDQRASDVHIEPKREKSLVRMRIDGVLHTVYQLPRSVHSAIVSRIKNMSRLDMAEKRKPQDGRIKMDKAGVEAEIRVSMVPVAFGEKVVMRIMDPEVLFQDLEGLGFTAKDLEKYKGFISMPHGIVLVCGPTGSGKSTTLYSTLRGLSSPEINIVTVEDPIEMIHESFNQIAVQPVVGITFGNILRNILRQDPDIIMIGEMRDLETAENAVQAALTGHLVLSTLHTNDAPSAITRLLDLGIPSFLIQATLIGAVAQRLVRRICPQCRESFFMDGEALRSMGLHPGSEGGLSHRVELSRGRGCVRCRGTGYHGREGVFEVLPFTESMKSITTEHAELSAIQALSRKEGMVTLRENALLKLLEGKTTHQEVLRVTWGEAL